MGKPRGSGREETCFPALFLIKNSNLGVRYETVVVTSERKGGVMDVGKLLERIIAQNDLIIRQNELLLRFLAARANKKDDELLAELKEFNRKQERRRGS